MTPKKKHKKQKNPPGTRSPNTTRPSSAAPAKFAPVLTTLTRSASVAAVSARVNSAHIAALPARFSARRSCVLGLVREGEKGEGGTYGAEEEVGG